MPDEDAIRAARAQIDELDDRLLALLEERAALARHVGEEKRKNGSSVFAVPEREAQILRRLQDKAAQLPPAAVRAIYREIISACLACEAPLSVAYFGPAGTFTHEAALKLFGSAADLQPMKTIEATFAAAEKEVCAFAVVPFENSAAGTVGATMDALVRTPLSISGETVLRIRHNLLCADAALPLAQVAEVHAHPHALEQCRAWLQEHAPQAAQHAADSTAAAAQLAAAGKRGTAAIGSALAAEKYQLATLAAAIEDFGNNSTRFLMLGARASKPSGADKTSFIMSVRDAPGEMFKVLQPLADNQVNMVKLESRPLRERLWEYLFFVDFIGHRDDAGAQAALAQVQQRASFMKILGSYPQAVA